MQRPEGLPCAGCSLFQLAQQQIHNRSKLHPSAKLFVVKTYLRKHKKCWRGTGRANKKSEKQQRGHHRQRKRRKRCSIVLKADIPNSLWKSHGGEDDFTDRNFSLWRIHARSEEKGEKEGMARRKSLYTDCNIPPHPPLHPSRTGQRSQV